MRKIIVLLAAVSLLTGCASVDPYKPKGSGSFYGRDLGYEEKQIAPNKWLVTFNTGAYTKKDKAWTLLYRRVEEFGKLKCPAGHKIAHQETDYEYIGDTPITIARAVVECTNS